MGMGKRSIGWMVFGAAVHGFGGMCLGLAVDLHDFQLAPPDAPRNVLTVNLNAGLGGQDTERSDLSGTVSAMLDVDVSTGSAVPTGLVFTGGRILVEDASFRLAFGFITADAQGLAGTPSTPIPPGPVTDNTFAGANHQLTLDQGNISANVGPPIDFSVQPLSAAGVGTGTVVLHAVGIPTGHETTYDVVLSLPLAATESFDVEGFSVDLLATTQLILSQRVTIPILPGDYDSDGTWDCDDLDLLSAEITAGTHTAKYDANLDGQVNPDDVVEWVTGLRETSLGDADLDGAVDENDFAVWNNHVFTAENSWCNGDFNTDGFIDAADFNIWNNHASAAGAARAVVPEPCFSTWLMGIAAAAAMWFRSRHGAG